MNSFFYVYVHNKLYGILKRRFMCSVNTYIEEENNKLKTTRLLASNSRQNYRN